MYVYSVKDIRMIKNEHNISTYLFQRLHIGVKLFKDGPRHTHITLSAADMQNSLSLLQHTGQRKTLAHSTI